MNTKPVLMIHEVSESLFNLPLKDYVLTFDDGLYSQYWYFDRFKSIPTEKIYFISSGIICNSPQSAEFPSCVEAHKKARNGITEDFMTVTQIKELMQDPLVTIGAHSHNHVELSNISKLPNKVAHIRKDTEQMLNWFKDNLEFRPTAFCYPYNDNLYGIYTGLLKEYGFTSFYGSERIPVETLQQQ